MSVSLHKMPGSGHYGQLLEADSRMEPSLLRLVASVNPSGPCARAIRWARTVGTRVRVVQEIWVCDNCLMVAVNGDDSGRGEDEPQPWSLISDSGFVMGTDDHISECDRDETCECGDLGFCWTSCQACGNLPGNRTAMVRLNR